MCPLLFLASMELWNTQGQVMKIPYSLFFITVCHPGKLLLVPNCTGFVNIFRLKLMCSETSFKVVPLFLFLCYTVKGTL